MALGELAKEGDEEALVGGCGEENEGGGDHDEWEHADRKEDAREDVEDDHDEECDRAGAAETQEKWDGQVVQCSCPGKGVMGPILF